MSIGVDGPITPCLLQETYDKLLGHYSIRSRTKKACMGRCWSVRLSLRTAAATHPSDCFPWTPHLTSSWTTTSTISTSLLPMVNHDLVYSWHIYFVQLSCVDELFGLPQLPAASKHRCWHMLLLLLLLTHASLYSVQAYLCSASTLILFECTDQSFHLTFLFSLLYWHMYIKWAFSCT